VEPGWSGWDQLFETTSLLMVFLFISQTVTALKTGKLGKSHALVTFNKKIVERQKGELKMYADVIRGKDPIALYSLETAA
jgi:hypothetical protein